ncbi:ElyC/SanA/YdcF family protein [Spiribacter onubensis]|uniref:ElyC/SanA/YdcF family protein n=1 Tax=Spiribacter onubensis TaxID=3122420 RepID=A0ABV3SC97_9GAMM
MFFFTKLAGALLKPLSLVVIALVIGLILAAFTRWRRSGLALIGVTTLALALISWWPVSNSLMTPLEGVYAPIEVSAPERAGGQVLPRDVAAIVVLGGGAVDDPSLPLSAQLSATSLQRLIEGIRLWRLRSDALLVTSGALPRGRSQAAIAADLAVALGVPRERIRMLPAARNTAEEAAAYAELVATVDGDGTSAGPVEAAALRQPVVVSSASHLPRAIAEFKSQGLEPLPAPTAHRASPQRFALPGDFAPQADDLRTTEAAWHEMLGRLWAWLRGRG